MFRHVTAAGAKDEDNEMMPTVRRGYYFNDWLHAIFSDNRAYLRCRLHRVAGDRPEGREEPDSSRITMRVDEPLREDSRFQSILKDMNLSQ